MGRQRIVLSAMLVGALSGSPAAALAGDAAKGRQLSIERCARCHVIGDYNRTGGLDSTPSFQWLKRMADYRERLLTFFARPPHPVFVRVPGVEQPGGTAYATVFEITPEQIEDILAFVETLETPR